MDLQQIEQSVQAEMDSMNMLVDKGMADYTFYEYKGLYDTYIQIKIAQALAGINEKLNTITERGGSADLVGSSLDGVNRMLHIIADK